MHEPLPHRSTIAGTERHIFHRDIESRSRVDLRTVGADKYAADPSTDVYCYAYAVDDGPVKLWIRGDPVPAEAVEAAKNPTWSVLPTVTTSRPRWSGTSWRHATAFR